MGSGCCVTPFVLKVQCCKNFFITDGLVEQHTVCHMLTQVLQHVKKQHGSSACEDKHHNACGEIVFWHTTLSVYSVCAFSFCSAA